MRGDMKHLVAILVVAILSGCAGYDKPAMLKFGEDVELDQIYDISHDVPSCPPTGWTRAQLHALKAADFEVSDFWARQLLARKITGCLASPDPALRDGIAFEALSHTLRAKQLDDETKRALLVELSVRLGSKDTLGFEHPFAVLALAEVARADRIEPFLTREERTKLLVAAQHWFINISDYRGFDDKEGWRHSVAHGSDLLMQLALNPAIDDEGLRVIVSAVEMQVAPAGHAYVTGESERLARPILYAASRGVMSEQEWTEWFGALAKPRAEVFTSEAGLAWRHDVMAFLQSLYVNVVIGSDPNDDVIRPGLEAARKALP